MLCSIILLQQCKDMISAVNHIHWAEKDCFIFFLFAFFSISDISKDINSWNNSHKQKYIHLLQNIINSPIAWRLNFIKAKFEISYPQKSFSFLVTLNPLMINVLYISQIQSHFLSLACKNLIFKDSLRSFSEWNFLF